jgi:arsenate reductase
LLAEFVGTAFLLAGIVGSGIMAERLTDDVGLQLLINAFATSALLVALILALGAVSGAHFNPAVTVADRLLGGIATPTAFGYVIVQVSGAVTGVMVANAMFDLPLIEMSTTERTGGHLLLAEAVATMGLLLVIFGVVRSGRSSMVAVAVGAYIGAAYWFTSSTSFANPAVTVARTLSDTFAGIAPTGVAFFIVVQLVATVAAVALIRALYPDIAEVADEVVVPHGDSATRRDRWPVASAKVDSDHRRSAEESHLRRLAPDQPDAGGDHDGVAVHFVESTACDVARHLRERHGWPEEGHDDLPAVGVAGDDQVDA